MDVWIALFPKWNFAGLKVQLGKLYERAFLLSFANRIAGSRNLPPVGQGESRGVRECNYKKI
jgi:hypothetical protein